MKDSSLHWLFDVREREYTNKYNKMLDDWDNARAMCKKNAWNIQENQIVETKEATAWELAHNVSQEKLLVLKDQESKLHQDMTNKKKKLMQQIEMNQGLEIQWIEHENHKNDDLFLNHKEFGFNKWILNEMTKDDIHEDSQEKVIRNGPP